MKAGPVMPIIEELKISIYLLEYAQRLLARPAVLIRAGWTSSHGFDL
jgi:hypothetical protein